MTDPFAVTVAVLALAISGTTAWLTLFRRGTVNMTRPTVIFFGPDSPRPGERVGKSKVYLRALLFATSKRGRVIESMHVSLSRSESRQNFNIWVYGENKQLVRGSGLFIGETGIAVNHHFLTPGDAPSFSWVAGAYQLNVYAKLLGDADHILLFAQQLEITIDAAALLSDAGAGLYFDWGPDSLRYIPHVEKRSPVPDPSDFAELLGLGHTNESANGRR